MFTHDLPHANLSYPISDTKIHQPPKCAENFGKFYNIIKYFPHRQGLTCAADRFSAPVFIKMQMVQVL